MKALYYGIGLFLLTSCGNNPTIDGFWNNEDIIYRDDTTVPRNEGITRFECDWEPVKKETLQN